MKFSGLRSPFVGFEVSEGHFARGPLQTQAQGVNAKWVRLNNVSWRSIQPTPDRVYNWDGAAAFESDARAAYNAGLTPMVIVDDSPYWATKVDTACGALKEEAFDDFAAFMQQLVNRYKNPPFNVHNWEFGNEVDVDPSLVEKDNIFGCWGNSQDPYYGGEHYGNMLKVVTPAVKAADPAARVMNGGLLLFEPAACTGQVPSLSSCFFEGMLKAGAAPYLDIVTYHAYATFVDADKYTKPARKLQFLKDLMAKYGVSKPLILNETSLRCVAAWTPALCKGPSTEFLEAQADFVPRLIVRSLNQGAESVIWYTLNGSGWDNGGLLTDSSEPRQSYRALQTLGEQTVSATGAPVAVSYSNGTEAYRFTTPGKLIDVVWSTDASAKVITLPAAKLIAAFDRDGTRLDPVITNGTASFQVDGSAMYLHRQP